MKVQITRVGRGLPRKVWDRTATAQLGQVARSAMLARLNRGVGTDDQELPEYSSKPIWISRTGKTAERLAPKGGRPSRTGKSVHYKGGWRQFKLESTGSRSRAPRLSGQLLRSLRILRVNRMSVEIGFSGEARIYGAHLQRKGRKLMGLSRRDRQIIKAALPVLLRKAMDRHRRLRPVGGA